MTAAPERKGQGSRIATGDLPALQSPSLLRFSCSVLSTLASNTDILTLIHILGGSRPDTHLHRLHRRTHLRIQYNSLAANHPRSPPRETATSCLPQGPPPGGSVQHKARIEPLSAPGSPDRALPASPYPERCTVSVTVHELRLTCPPGWHALLPLLGTHAHAYILSQAHQLLPAISHAPHASLGLKHCAPGRYGCALGHKVVTSFLP